MERQHTEASQQLERYICRVRMAGCTAVDRIEIEQEIGDAAAAEHRPASRRLPRAGGSVAMLPAFVLFYLPLVSLVLVWPAVALRFLADMIVHTDMLVLHVPWEVWAIAERIAAVRVTSFDPVETSKALLRTWHYFAAPVALWWVVLGVWARAFPRPAAGLFAPLVGPRRTGRAWIACGVLLLLGAGLYGGAKLAGTL